MKDTLQIIFGLFGGLAVFIYGMNLMSESLQKAAGEKMKKVLALLTKNRLLGVLAGALATAVLQSSSATIAVLQNFAAQPEPDGVTSIMGLAGAIPVLLGDNIGTTITALLACIGQSKNAKRTAAAHCIFNISGSLVFIWFVKPYAAFIQQISPKGIEVEVISRQIANAHTGFNLCMTIVWTILLGVMVKLVMRLIPDGKTTVENPSEPVYLDYNLINQPAAALQLVAKEVLHCSEVVKDMLRSMINVAEGAHSSLIEMVHEKEDIVNNLNEKITDYLADSRCLDGRTGNTVSEINVYFK